MKKITSKIWRNARDEMADSYNFRPTMKLFKRVVSRYPELVKELIYHSDTSVKEMLVDKFALWLTNKSWPIGSDSKRYSNAFFREFHAACKEENIRCFKLEDYLTSRVRLV